MFGPRHHFIDPFDIALLLYRSYVQCSVEFTRPSAVAPAIAEAIRYLNGFRTRFRWLHISAIDHKPPVYKIPSDLSTLPEVNEWIHRAHTPEPSDVLGTIAADDRRLVVNIHHCVADGRLLVGLIEHLSNPSAYGTVTAPLVPKSAFDYFAKEIAAHDPIPMCAKDPGMTRVFPKRPLVPADRADFLTHYLVESPSAFRSFNPRTGRCAGMTEMIWAGLMLSASAFTGQIAPAGISTVVDARRFLPPDIIKSHAYQNCVTAVQVHTQLDPSLSIHQVTSEMRKQLEKKIREGAWLGYLKSAYNGVWRPWIRAKPVPGWGIQSSSLGVIKVKDPVRDAFIGQQCPGSQAYDGISFVSQAIENLDEKTVKFVGGFQHTTQELHRDDGRILAESVRFCLKEIDDCTKIGDALDRIRQFQSSIDVN
jgi:hypothetical protein